MDLIILNMQSTDYFKNLIFYCMMRTHCSACPCCSTQIDTWSCSVRWWWPPSPSIPLDWRCTRTTCTGRTGCCMPWSESTSTTAVTTHTWSRTSTDSQWESLSLLRMPMIVIISLRVEESQILLTFNWLFSVNYLLFVCKKILQELWKPCCKPGIYSSL